LSELPLGPGSCATMKKIIMKGVVQDIEGLAVKGKARQLVVMALRPKEEIGAEVHKLDQALVFGHAVTTCIPDGRTQPYRPQ
jgi:hypothetical protein